ncbi:hypothetical protein [Micromonospora sp. RV43]|uniref:hypothetical protein n=1 Tax=Micromonospora sp. RV43 TaxID=1661387 RepID=UPI00064BDB9A|nr:hypothetical protein [Micromonospora sp. RV43]
MSEPTATWRPARPGDTPGELTPEHGPTQPIDAAPTCSHGHNTFTPPTDGLPRHVSDWRLCSDSKPRTEPLSWDDCATVANALSAAPGSGEIWRSSYGDIVGEPLSLARVAVEALSAAGRLPAAPHLPLLTLTAAEIEALLLAAAKYRAIDTRMPALNAALLKLQRIPDA